MLQSKHALLLIHPEWVTSPGENRGGKILTFCGFGFSTALTPSPILCLNSQSISSLAVSFICQIEAKHLDPLGKYVTLSLCSHNAVPEWALARPECCHLGGSGEYP